MERQTAGGKRMVVWWWVSVPYTFFFMVFARLTMPTWGLLILFWIAYFMSIVWVVAAILNVVWRPHWRTKSNLAMLVVGLVPVLYFLYAMIHGFQRP